MTNIIVDLSDMEDMKTKKKNPHLTQNSQYLRRNMTKEEKRLWYEFLKKLPVVINRQKVIDHYIVDFYCAEANVAIELDGSQHYEDEEKAKDEIRDEHLASLGIKVLRYSNLDIHQRFEEVCNDILKNIEMHTK